VAGLIPASGRGPIRPRLRRAHDPEPRAWRPPGNGPAGDTPARPGAHMYQVNGYAPGCRPGAPPAAPFRRFFPANFIRKTCYLS